MAGRRPRAGQHGDAGRGAPDAGHGSRRQAWAFATMLQAMAQAKQARLNDATVKDALTFFDWAEWAMLIHDRFEAKAILRKTGVGRLMHGG